MDARRLRRAAAAVIALFAGLPAVASCTYETLGAGAPSIGGDGTVGPIADSGAGSDSGASGCGQTPNPTCTPACTSSATPTWVAARPARPRSCPGTQVDDYYTACIASTATLAKCAQVQAADPTCRTCIESLEGAAQYGPLIVYASIGRELNVGGCIANAKNDPSDACARAYLFRFECERSVCGQCPIANAQTLDDYHRCADAADRGACASYTAQIDTCKALLTGTAAQCAASTELAGGFRTIAALFCQ